MAWFVGGWFKRLVARVASRRRNQPTVLGKSAINSAGRQIFLPNVAAKIGAVDFGRPSLPADPQRLHAGGHGLTHLVRQDERGLVLHVEFAGQRQHALALHLVAEGSDREQISSQRQLVPGEQCA